MSFWLGACGSVAMSEAPIRAKAWVISGTARRIACSVAASIATDWSRFTVGSRCTSTTSDPSSSRGRNSAPSRGKIHSASTPSTAAAPSSVRRPGGETAQPRSGWYARSSTRMSGVVPTVSSRRGGGVLAQKPPAERGHQGQAQHQRRQQGQRRHGRERAEHLAFHPAQPQDGQVDQRDEHASADRRRGHLAAPGEDRGVTLGLRQRSPQFPAAGGEPPGDVVHRDDGPVYQQAKVDGSQAHQIAAEARDAQPGQPGHESQGDHGNDDERSAPVAQQEQVHRHHEKRAFEQVAAHGAQHAVHQRGAIVEGAQFHPGGQPLLQVG